MQKNILYTAQNCLNTLFVQGAESYGIHEILFYNKSGVLATYNRGSLERRCKTLTKVVFDTEIKTKRTIDYSCGSHFVVVTKKPYWYEKFYSLYLNVDLLDNFVKVDHVQDVTTKTEQGYKDVISFDVVCRFGADGDLKKDTLKFDCNFVWIDTPFGKRCKDLEKVAKEHGISNFTSYDFKNLLSIFNISVKRNG